MLIPLSLFLSLGRYIPVAANLVHLVDVRLFYQATRSVKKHLLLVIAGRHNRSTAAGKHVMWHLGLFPPGIEMLPLPSGEDGAARSNIPASGKI